MLWYYILPFFYWSGFDHFFLQDLKRKMVLSLDELPFKKHSVPNISETEQMFYRVKCCQIPRNNRRFVSFAYSNNNSDLNELCFNIFKDSCSNELRNLPPLKDALLQHVLCAAYQATSACFTSLSFMGIENPSRTFKNELDIGKCVPALVNVNQCWMFYKCELCVTVN